MYQHGIGYLQGPAFVARPARCALRQHSPAGRRRPPTGIKGFEKHGVQGVQAAGRAGRGGVSVSISTSGLSYWHARGPAPPRSTPQSESESFASSPHRLAGRPGSGQAAPAACVRSPYCTRCVLRCGAAARGVDALRRTVKSGRPWRGAGGPGAAGCLPTGRGDGPAQAAARNQ